MENVFVHESSCVDEDVEIGAGTKIWHFCHIRSGARIGQKCSFGQNVFVGQFVHIGNGVKVQNNVSIYERVTLEDYVFCGPSCVFTNVLTPRSRYPKDYSEYLETIVRHDVTIGANATIVCGHTLGEYATIAAGAVVTQDVPPHALMAGVPAKQIGWVCICGQVLGTDLVCPDCGRQYRLEKNMDAQSRIVLEKE